jgi:hypothetical protein
VPALAAEAIEQAVVRIAAVDAARVVVVDDVVREVHIVANRSRPAKHIGRDVQSLLAATWGVEVDPRIVSVVQLGGGAEVDLTRPAAPVQDRRIKTELGTVTITFDGESSTATVEISAGEQVERGMSVGAPTLLRRLVASATLDALRRLGKAGPGEVDGVVTARVGDQDLVVASLAVAGASPRAGAAVIDARGELDAAARAILAAFR